MSNTREFDDASFEDFLDSVPEVEPPAQLKDVVFERIERTPQETTTVVAGAVTTAAVVTAVVRAASATSTRGAGVPGSRWSPRRSFSSSAA